MSDGYDFIWDELSGLNPADVARNALAAWDGEKRTYTLRSLGMEFNFHLKDRTVTPCGPDPEDLIGKFEFFFLNSALMYLVKAKGISPTGKLIKPAELKGGDIFSKGTHVLPLEGVARRYGNDSDAFIRKGRALGAEPAQYGDASISLLPLPRVPVTMILWLGDEEFPPRASLLLDSSSEFQLPLDALWSVAMLSTLVMT